ncbi:MAG: hypothetical protein ACFE9T_14320 [Promethearchaeota archaeon]
MNLFNNSFDDTKEIIGFSKEELLEIKKTLKKFESENTEESEIENYIKSKLNLSTQILDSYSNYLNDLKVFLNQYLLKVRESESNTNYYYLKSEIADELNLISKNLHNLNSNSRNIKRTIKNKAFLDDLITNIKNLGDEYSQVHSLLKNSLKKIEKDYEDEIYLWIETNKIKNLSFKLNKLPSTLENWNDISDLYIFIRSLNDVFPKKGKQHKKERILSFHFDELYQYYLSKDEQKIKPYLDLTYLLYVNNIFEEYESEEFINILERKEVIQHLQDLIRPLTRNIIADKLKNVIDEIEDFHLTEKDSKLNIKALLNEKMGTFFPKIVEYYINALEKKFQEKINDVDQSKEFEEIASFYYNKIDDFSSIIDDIEDWILRFENFLKPYENITNSLKKTLVNVSSEIFRRKNEYLNFIETVKNEDLRVSTRKFVDEKISGINELITAYEDQTSLIIKEEFPQLKHIREIFSDYNKKIQTIKEEVYKKLNSVKTHDVDLYQIIKYWEDNFNRKRQQLAFLISLLLNKLFKSFKELIEKEGLLFATITEITEQTENFEELPLNFALSSFLAERLSEEELKERITEINSKINQLNNSLGLYQVELSKLEKILSTRVKIRKGIAQSDVQCTVCHNFINFAKDKVITCPFCASTYHYLCVAFWLSKYNSCPMCQNHFLEPHSELFENSEDE